VSQFKAKNQKSLPSSITRSTPKNRGGFPLFLGLFLFCFCYKTKLSVFISNSRSSASHLVATLFGKQEKNLKALKQVLSLSLPLFLWYREEKEKKYKETSLNSPLFPLGTAEGI
jgi:hypothetical protein